MTITPDDLIDYTDNEYYITDSHKWVRASKVADELEEVLLAVKTTSLGGCYRAELKLESLIKTLRGKE